MLYPFKFNPIYKKRAWGSESWLLSGLEDDLTDVSNGFLEENAVNELTEVYMGEMVGDKIYDKFGYEFPLLIKTINAEERLSVQVHPCDELATKRHNAYGKSELWYITEAAEGAEICMGFKKGTVKDDYLKALEKGEIETILNFVKVKKGDIYYIPSGMVHSIGAGVKIIEIQQTSDITYRIFDWNRKDDGGDPRELHTELAVDAIDFKAFATKNLRKEIAKGVEEHIISTPYFKLSMIDVAEAQSIDYGTRGSFTILMCVEGEGEIEYDIDGIETIKTGELVLLPAELEEMNLYGNMKLLNIHI